MEDSILTSIKLALGLPEEYDVFDPQLVMHINSAISVLTELGVGPESGFKITGKDEVWNDFLDDPNLLELCKTTTYLRVRLMFDPPANSFVVTSIEKQLSEYDWRINIMIDNIRGY